MFAATVQDSFGLDAGSSTGLYLTHLLGQPVPGDRFDLAGATRILAKVDDRRRIRDCQSGAPLQGAPHLLVAVTPALDTAARQHASGRRISTGPEADQSLGQRYPDAQHLPFGRRDDATARQLDLIRNGGCPAILHPQPRLDIRCGQIGILLDGDNDPAVVIQTTRTDAFRADDIPDRLLRLAGYDSLAEWRAHNADLGDDATILFHGFKVIEVVG